jgi:hypothetical protein
MVLISCSIAKSQWYSGASARMLSDEKSWGGSFELGKQCSFGWLFVQGAYINHQFDYDQTFNEVTYFPQGEGVFTVERTTVLGGRTYAPGEYSASAYSAYFPHGPEYTISATYCYPLTGSIMFGPTIGIVYQNQAPVAAVEVSEINNVPQYLYGPFAPPGEDSPILPGTKRIIVGNFGGCVKIALSGRDLPALLILDYANETGAGAGLAFPF